MTWIPNGVQCPRSGNLSMAGPTRTCLPLCALPQPHQLEEGLRTFITAWQWVPDIPLFCGHDDEDYQPRLVELARSLGLTERRHFLGAVSDAHKWALYSHAQLFVLPRTLRIFGNVVAEAMAMGCP